MSKTLVAYFSAQGSTAKLAKALAAAAGAELYEIKPAVPYERRDLNWMDKKSRTTVEMQDKSCRPALADTDAPVAEADTTRLRRIPYLVASLCDLGGNLVPVNILHIAEKLVNCLCVDRRALNHSRLDLFEIFRFYGLT